MSELFSNCNAKQISEDSNEKHILIRDIVNCARCGDDHVALIATRFERPFAPSDAYPLEWTHWVTCPTNGDPILVRVLPVLENGEL